MSASGTARPRVRPTGKEIVKNLVFFGVLSSAKERLEDAGVAAAYPEYYLQEFHAYDEGNLNWKVCGRGGARVTCVGGAPLLYPLENSDVLTHPVMTGGL